jgi:RNA polymerase sigma factor (sigma-70 family)
MSTDLRTASLHDMLGRFQAGDDAALDELIRRTSDRLDRLARKMLRGFPLVRAREQTQDILQNALVRLTRSLREVRPASIADYFRLAAEQVRRELLDLARFHRRRIAVNHTLAPADVPDLNSPHGGDMAADLERWHAFHEAVEQLPAALREVFGLKFYHGWTQVQIAELLGVSDRQVRQLWRDACLRLNDLLGGDLPPP